MKSKSRIGQVDEAETQGKNLGLMTRVDGLHRERL